VSVVDARNKSIVIKIVYYGCALGGKTTNLVSLHALTDPKRIHGLVSIATNDDRTLFFDLLPMDLGQIGGLSVQVKLYTVPGQVQYELTRRQVLRGADGVVFVADSGPDAAGPNVLSFKDLYVNMRANGLDTEKTPVLLQFNKRDLPDARPVKEMQADLERKDLPVVESVATEGAGVVDSFAAILKDSIVYAYRRTGQADVPRDKIERTVEAALAGARDQTLSAVAAPSEKGPDARFNMDEYVQNRAASQGHRVVDPDSLLKESVQTNMMLAEKLDGLREGEARSNRRGEMMEALSMVAPMLVNPKEDALPSGVLASLLAGAARKQGSLLLFRSGKNEMEDREAVPEGSDPFGRIVDPTQGSLAYRLSKDTAFRVFEDLEGEIFFGPLPGGIRDLASVLLAPLECDGIRFGSILIYSQISEGVFDNIEQEYWRTASTLVGLSLHWRALRRKLMKAV